MAASKKKKRIAKWKEKPQTEIVVTKNPDSFYNESPSWRFSDADVDPECPWSICKEHLQNDFWDSVLCRLQKFESMSYKEIFLQAKKQHHQIDVSKLNTVAIKRLEELRIEEEALYSLSISGTHRIYGYIINQNFHILWYDTNHGDNDTCVCRSKKKHT